MTLNRLQVARGPRAALATLILALAAPESLRAAPPVLRHVPTLETAPLGGLGYALALASDPDGDALSWVRPMPADLPAGASLVDLGTTLIEDTPTLVGLISWTPTRAQVGDYGIPFEVSDGTSTASGVGTIRVVAPPTAIRDRDGDGVVTVTCIGDSNTSTPNPATLPRWCERLGALLDGATEGGVTELTWETVNRGIPATYADADWVSNALADGRPDVMIFAFGTNDLRLPRTPQQVIEIYGHMMQRAWQAGVRAFVATTPEYYVQHGPPADCTLGNPAGVAALNALVVETFAPDVVDFHGGIVCPDDVPDWLHFTPSGHDKRARAAFDVLVPKPRVARCNGVPATIVGTAAGDRLVGTPGDDVIAAIAGSDRVFGRGGHDVICGGPGDDDLRGEGGNDVLVGGPGNDILLGASGNDTLFGDAGRNVLRGAKGNDVCAPGDPGSLVDRACELVLPAE